MHIILEENHRLNQGVVLLSCGIPQEDDLGLEVVGALFLGTEVGLRILARI